MRIIHPALACASLCNATQTCTPLDPFPQEYKCKITGVTDPSFDDYLALNFPARSFRACRDLTARRGPPYLSFAYDKGNSACQISSVPVGMRNVTADSDSNTTYSDIQCFNCPFSCPRSDEGFAKDSLDNPIDNPGFESSVSSIGPWMGTGGQLASPGFNSTTSYQYLGSAFNSYGNLRQSFRACSGQFHRVSFDYKASGFGGNLLPKVILSLDQQGQSGVGPQVFTTFSGNTTGWTPGVEYYRASLEVAHEINLQIGISILDTIVNGSFDNVRIVPIASPFRAVGNATELLKGGGFESGNRRSWQIESIDDAIIVSPGIKSRYALQAGYRIVMSQDITTTAGKDYLFAFDYALQVDSGRGYVVELDITGGSTTSSFSSVELTSGNFTYVHPFVGRAETTSFRFVVSQICIGGCGDNTTITVDNLSIKELA